MADQDADEGSNFYNTPIGGSPFPLSHVGNSVEAERTSLLMNPRPQIPGLSLCNDPNGLDIPSHVEQAPPEYGTLADSLDRVITAIEAATNGDAKGTTEKTNGANDFDTKMGGTDSQDNAPETLCEASTIILPPTNESTIPIIDTTHAEETSAPINGESAPDTRMEEREWETDSSPYESSSDSSSDSSDDSSDEDDYELLNPEEQARILLAAAGSDDEDGKDEKSAAKSVRTANEKAEEVIPKPNIVITADTKVEMLGNVESVVDNIVLVKANISGEYQVLETGSVLCSANLEVIGVVSDTFGKVEQPMYTIHFTDSEEIKTSGLEKGVPVFYVVDLSTFVFTQPLKGLKGSDASNLHDEEIGEDEVEFSDDEAEAAYNRQLKLKRQQKREGRSEQSNGGKRRGGPGPSALRHTELNYDDEPQEDGYNTLQRPKDFHEQMSRDQPRARFHDRSSERGFRGGRGRGKGRGHERGRGGRDSGRHQHHRDNYHPPPPSERSPQMPHQFSNRYPEQTQSHNGNASPNTSAPPQAFPQTYSAFSPQVNQPQTQFPFPNFSFPQQNTLPFPPPGSHINPAFFSNLLLQQHQQQPQYATQNGSSIPPVSPISQRQADAFAAAQAQLDTLKRLSGGGT
ncbi:hypothetical protein LOZ65_001039 [Ophidiomyces ophidiicola]|nr:hypothetical protein LOZ65_001039 [Ophidiomyces ophidiicola]